MARASSRRPGRRTIEPTHRSRSNALSPLLMRACFETQKLEQLEERMEKIIDHVPYARITDARIPDEAERYPN
jgi:hypothetical protein